MTETKIYAELELKAGTRVEAQSFDSDIVAVKTDINTCVGCIVLQKAQESEDWGKYSDIASTCNNLKNVYRCNGKPYIWIKAEDIPSPEKPAADPALEPAASPAESPAKQSALDRQPGGDHYRKTSIQPVVYNHANNLGFCEGNIVKYATRWRQKGGKEDILKIIHYAELLLELEGLDKK